MACVSGELGCCELELENTDPGPIGRLCLVRQTPGLVSVGKKNEEKSLSFDREQLAPVQEAE